jgi:hypothetical protein
LGASGPSSLKQYRLPGGASRLAEVNVHLIEAEGAWTPYWSLDDAYKLDDVREALRRKPAIVDRQYIVHT